MLILISVWFIGGTLTILSQWIISPGVQESTNDYLQYYWIVFIEVTSGFDVGGEVERLNYLRFVITILMLIAGMIIGGLVSGQIIAIILNAAQKAGLVAEAPENFKFIDPIIIFGNNKHLHGIISSVRQIDGNANRDIIIIDEEANEISILDKSDYKNIWYIKSDPSKRNYLKGIKTCNFAFFKKYCFDIIGFNNNFEGWGREDSEFAVRLLNSGIIRKNLRFNAIQFHLWHSENTKVSLRKNDVMLNLSINNNYKWCNNGIDKLDNLTKSLKVVVVSFCEKKMAKQLRS
jgi:hypothetical protein